MPPTSAAVADKKIAFVHFERRVLLDLVQQHRDIVHDRRTDSTTVHRKQQIWQQITDEYNRHPSIARRRQTPQLKRLWQNTRARAKQAGVGRVIMMSTTTAPSVPAPPRHSIRNASAVLASSAPALRHPQVCTTIEAAVDVETSDDGDDDMQQIDKCLNPVISTRLRKIEESIAQQSELHRSQIYREQLVANSVQDEIQRVAERHALQLQQDRELHEIRISHELERHAQQMRHEQELQLLQLDEHAKAAAVATSYPIMYKQ